MGFKLLKRISNKTYGIIGFLIFFSAWEFFSKLQIISNVYLPPLENVLSSLWFILGQHDTYLHIADTLRNFGIGYGLALAMGVPFSYVMGLSKRLYSMFDPLISALFSAPLITLLPLFVIIFGIYDECKIAMIFIASIFPLIISLTAGLRAVPLDLIEMAKSFGANGFQLFYTIYLPASLPSFIAGLRVSFTRALIFTLVAEMYVSVVGIGHLISWSSQFVRMSEAFSYIFIVAFMAVCITYVLKYLETKMRGWGM
ncbi:MAG: ABC transporter permease [Candidatus Bathyarchaeia archaeon]